MGERTEALMRIVVAIISGIILGVWKAFVDILSIVHWFFVLIAGKRIKPFASFCNIWATQMYRFYRYMTFATNERPFPFSEFGHEMHPVQMKEPVKEIEVKGKKKKK